MNPSLQGYADALHESAGGEQLRQLAEESAALSRLVGSSAELRGVLTDTSIPPRARRAILDDLLGSRVSMLTRRAAGFAVAAVPAPEVPAALNWLASETERAHEGESEAEPLLARRAARERVGGYLAALEEDMAVEALEEAEDALFRLARIVESTPPLRAALTDRELPADLRAGVVHDLLAGKVGNEVLRLAEYAVRAGRPRDVVGTLDWLVERIAEARGWRVARVRAAREVDERQRGELGASLQRLVGLPVDLQVTEEPRLIGGAVIEVGDLQVDASARGRLDRLKERLAVGGWEESSLSTSEAGSHRDAGAAGDGERGAT